MVKFDKVIAISRWSIFSTQCRGLNVAAV